MRPSRCTSSRIRRPRAATEADRRVDQQRLHHDEDDDDPERELLEQGLDPLRVVRVRMEAALRVVLHRAAGDERQRQDHE